MFTGLILLTSDPHGLPALVEFLTEPVDINARKAVLRTLFDILGIELPSETVLLEPGGMDAVQQSCRSRFYTGTNGEPPLGAVSHQLVPGSR